MKTQTEASRLSSRGPSLRVEAEPSLAADNPNAGLLHSPGLPETRAVIRQRQLDVFKYLDYRAFLRVYYARRKKESRSFSFRSFARKAGLKSPNHLKRVMDGDRNLSEDAAIRYAEVLGLEGDAGGYFSELVRFNQAKTQREKSAAYRRLTQFRGYQKAQKLDVQHDRYHSEWYIPAVREMISRADFSSDPKWIAERLIPPITDKQAAEALDVLVQLGMLDRSEDGQVTRAERVVSTGPETSSLHVAHYHGTMAQKAMQSIDKVPAAERDISGVTLALPEGAIPELKERIRAFRKEVIALEAQDGDADRVVHVGIQMFPLTTGKKEQ